MEPNRRTVTVVCEHCSSLFEKDAREVSRKRRSKHFFCSRKCWYDHSHERGSVTTPCQNCGLEISRKKSQFENWPNHFCSKSCSAQHANAKRKWSRRSVAETALYDHIKERFPELEILPNDKTMLEGLEVDIAVPALKLAIEWNGAVHFKPIFGNDKLASIRSRDQRKLEIASREDVNLIVIADPDCSAEILTKAIEDVEEIILSLLEAERNSN